MKSLAVRDERELVVDNAADRLAYLVLSFGLLVLVAYRSFTRGESAWDLMGLVLLGGLVGTAYRARQRVISARWLAVAGAGLVVASVLAIVIVIVGRG